MGKRKVGESDSEGMDEDSSDDDSNEENEKSVVLSNGNNSDLNKEAEGSSDSVTGINQYGDSCAGALCTSGSEEEKVASGEQSLKYDSCVEIASSKEDEVLEAQTAEETVAHSANVTSMETAEIPENEAVKDEKHENVGLDSRCPDASSSGNGGVESKTVTAEANGSSESKTESSEEIVVANVDNCGMKPLNLDEFNAASDLEYLGMERLKTELQLHGLKCGGTLQERAARLFLLKSTPLDKLPKKLLAKK